MINGEIHSSTLASTISSIINNTLLSNQQFNIVISNVEISWNDKKKFIVTKFLNVKALQYRCKSSKCIKTQSDNYLNNLDSHDKSFESYSLPDIIFIFRISQIFYNQDQDQKFTLTQNTIVNNNQSNQNNQSNHIKQQTNFDIKTTDYIKHSLLEIIIANYTLTDQFFNRTDTIKYDADTIINVITDKMYHVINILGSHELIYSHIIQNIKFENFTIILPEDYRSKIQLYISRYMELQKYPKEHSSMLNIINDNCNKKDIQIHQLQTTLYTDSVEYKLTFNADKMTHLSLLIPINKINKAETNKTVHHIDQQFQNINNNFTNNPDQIDTINDNINTKTKNNDNDYLSNNNLNYDNRNNNDLILLCRLFISDENVLSKFIPANWDVDINVDKAILNLYMDQNKKIKSLVFNINCLISDIYYNSYYDSHFVIQSNQDKADNKNESSNPNNSNNHNNHNNHNNLNDHDTISDKIASQNEDIDILNLSTNFSSSRKVNNTKIENPLMKQYNNHYYTIINGEYSIQNESLLANLYVLDTNCKTTNCNMNSSYDSTNDKIKTSAIINYNFNNNTLNAVFKIYKLTTEELKRYWPINLAINTRTWFKEHVNDGYISNSNFLIETKKVQNDTKNEEQNTTKESELILSQDGTWRYKLLGSAMLYNAKSSYYPNNEEIYAERTTIDLTKNAILIKTDKAEAESGVKFTNTEIKINWSKADTTNRINRKYESKSTSKLNNTINTINGQNITEFKITTDLSGDIQTVTDFALSHSKINTEQDNKIAERKKLSINKFKEKVKNMDGNVKAHVFTVIQLIQNKLYAKSNSYKNFNKFNQNQIRFKDSQNDKKNNKKNDKNEIQYNNRNSNNIRKINAQSYHTELKALRMSGNITSFYAKDIFRHHTFLSDKVDIKLYNGDFQASGIGLIDQDINTNFIYHYTISDIARKKIDTKIQHDEIQTYKTYDINNIKWSKHNSDINIRIKTNIHKLKKLGIDIHPYIKGDIIADLMMNMDEPSYYNDNNNIDILTNTRKLNKDFSNTISYVKNQPNNIDISKKHIANDYNHLFVDLTDTEMEIPLIGIIKNRGSNCKLKLDFIIKDHDIIDNQHTHESIVIHNYNLFGNQIYSEGNAKFSFFKKDHDNISNITDNNIGDNISDIDIMINSTKTKIGKENFRFIYKSYDMVSNRRYLEISGDGMDISMLPLDSLILNADNVKKSTANIDLKIKIKKLILKMNQSIIEPLLEISCEKGICDKIYFDGNFLPKKGSRGGYLRIFYYDPIISLVSNNAGIMFKGFGIYNGLENGSIDIRAKFDNELNLVGKISMTNFFLKEKNFLLEILKFAAITSKPFSGIMELFHDGIKFNRIDCEAKYHSKYAEISKCLGSATTLNLKGKGYLDFNTNNMKFSGLITPAYILNTLFSMIQKFAPTIGEKLIGTNEDRVNFVVEGAIKSIDQKHNTHHVSSGNLNQNQQNNQQKQNYNFKRSKNVQDKNIYNRKNQKKNNNAITKTTANTLSMITPGVFGKIFEKNS